MTYQSLQLHIEDGIAIVAFDRPHKANALHRALWNELRAAFVEIDAHRDVRVAVLRGNGANFTAGIDLSMLLDLQQEAIDPHGCAGRTRENLRRDLLDLQDVVSTIERCRVPVLAAIHGACIGGGIDIACACDIRYCSADAKFSVKEVDLAVTADLGTLQRLPKIVGDGIARELAYTARVVDGREAQALGLVNRCYDSSDELFEGVQQMARIIAAKSPLAVRGSKEMLVHARDHSVAEGLNYVATWNAGMLLSSDLDEVIAAAMQKRKPDFGT
ncbi:crotonase/enoyl-CoA hydratase family protein [Lysobacter fragariae]